MGKAASNPASRTYAGAANPAPSPASRTYADASFSRQMMRESYRKVVHFPARRTNFFVNSERAFFLWGCALSA